MAAKNDKLPILADCTASTSAAAPDDLTLSEVIAELKFWRTHRNLVERDPTGEAAAFWMMIYTIMNRCLFGGQLPRCMITLERKGNAYGYFRPHAFQNLEGTTAHQIALNPACFTAFGDVEAYQTLAHEMCHLWREEFGPRNKNGSTGTPGYHCRHWVRKMEEIGLIPSHTGKPGGRKTGYQVADYLKEGGPLDLLIRQILIHGLRIDWRHPLISQRHTEAGDEAVAGTRTRGPRRRTRAKFSCPHCQQNARAKPKAKLICGVCHVPMINMEGKA
ncbi:MAG: SprT-like domain-containing protein [Pseudomonadota bacterium]